MREHFDLDTTPPEEDCAQLGSENYEQNAHKEARLYREQLERQFGKAEEHGCRFTIASNPHDAGTYYTLRLYFDTDNEQSCDYAYGIEGDGPGNWDEEAQAALQGSGKPNKEEEELAYAENLSQEDLQEMMFDSVVTACDGCQVEPDGTCQHGYRSPLLVLGIM